MGNICNKRRIKKRRHRRKQQSKTIEINGRQVGKMDTQNNNISAGFNKGIEKEDK